MNEDFAAAMRRAALSTRALNVAEATRIIQGALSGQALGIPAASSPAQTPARPKQQPQLRLIDPDAEAAAPSAEPAGAAAGRDTADIGSLQIMPRLRKPLGEVLQALRQGRPAAPGLGSLPGIDLPGMRRSSPPPLPDGAQFLARSFTGAAGTRSYKLYIPAGAPDRPRGLIVMLHGCKQDPDDFATGTNMNAVAERHGLLVAYPCQTGAANASSCWNWFNPADQMRDAGEPSILAGITREIMVEFGLDRDAVFVAGLSAGGAMAAVMGETYPDLYAAVGVHSGLPYRSANDVMSAFAAMRGDAGPGLGARPRAAAGRVARIRTIVFQGSADRTVHPSNADRIVAAATPPAAGSPRQDRGHAAGGRAYTRTLVAGPDGAAAVEHWLVHGVGHAWSGGCPGGSYTDPQGPDASTEMVRFFLQECPG